MNLAAKKTDWWSYGYAATVLGFPLMLFALSLEAAESGTTRTLGFIPFVSGVVALFFSNRNTLRRMLIPFRADSGRGTGRYLGVLGILSYTLGTTGLMQFTNNNLLMNFGFLLLGFAALWYAIRVLKFKEQTL